MVKDIFIPKSEKEILFTLESLYDITSKDEANMYLRKAIFTHNKFLIIYCLKKGATILDPENPTNANFLWLSINNDVGEDIIFELIKNKKVKESIIINKNNFKSLFLGKLSEVGYLNVAKYLLEKYTFSKNEIEKAMYHKSTHFINSKNTFNYLRTKLDESVISNLFKSKNNDKIIENIKDLSLENTVHYIFKIYNFYKYIDIKHKMMLLKNVPLIIQIWLKLRDAGALLRSFEYNFLEDGFVTLFFKYKKTNEIIRQFENENFVVFISNKNYPLWSQKIYDVKTFMKVMEEKTKGEG